LFLFKVCSCKEYYQITEEDKNSWFALNKNLKTQHEQKVSVGPCSIESIMKHVHWERKVECSNYNCNVGSSLLMRTVNINLCQH